MNINTLVSSIDETLRTSLDPKLRVQFAGRVNQFYDSQAKRAAVLRYEGSKPVRFTIDTVNYDVQIAHRLIAGQPVKNPNRFGSRQRIDFDLVWSLMVATRKPEIMTQVLLNFSHLSAIEVSEFNTDSLSVLKREFHFVPDPKMAYDPALQAFAIQYRMLNISDQVFSELCNYLSTI